jgi:hypothetical protein
MTQHTDLIDRLRLLAADMDEERRPTSSSVADAAANTLEAQAREIERLCKDAALVAARERERIANHIEDCRAPIAVHGARVEIGLTTRIAYANSIRALNTEGEGNAL